MSGSREFRQTYAEVHLPNVAHNFKVFRDIVGSDTFLCPMVKANAYGHGDIEVSRTLIEAGAEQLGVVLIEEGIRLRSAQINVPILIFGFFDESGAREICRHHLTPVLSSWEQIRVLEKQPLAERSQPVHLKFNTGMSRLGFEVEDASELKKHFQQSSRLRLEGVCTHLASGENMGITGGTSEAQLQKFKKIQSVFQDMPVVYHLLNSAGALALAAAGRSAQERAPNGRMWSMGCRPGIGIYGINPEGSLQLTASLKPVMTLKSHVVLLRRLAAGERVSYGGKWATAGDALIGVLPIGYADGYSRLLSGRSSVLCMGERVPVIGTVCMDYIMIDLTEVEKKHGSVPLNEEVVLFGNQGEASLPVTDVAAWLGTISYEVLARMGERVPRHYIK